MSAETVTPEAAFAQALRDFQSELPHVGKNQTGDAGSYSYEYADLTAITEAALPVLTKHGLSFSCKPHLRLEDGKFVLRYVLRHVAGHADEGDYPLPTQANSQQIGSAISYGRRYCFCAVTGIAPGGEDDDGKKAEDAKIGQPTSDAAWLDEFDNRVTFATNETEIAAIQADAQRKLHAGEITSTDAKRCKKALDARLAEIKGQPS